MSWIGASSALLAGVIVTIVGAAACLFVMAGLPRQAWVRFGWWLAIGVATYLIYGYRHSRLRDGAGAPTS